jgi:hypothetical protein
MKNLREVKRHYGVGNDTLTRWMRDAGISVSHRQSAGRSGFKRAQKRHAHAVKRSGDSSGASNICSYPQHSSDAVEVVG